MNVAIAAGTFDDIEELVAEFTPTATVREVVVSDPDSLESLEDYDGLIVGLHQLQAAHFARLPHRLRVIGRAGIGLDSIDLDAAAACGVAVVHQPSYATEEVATHAAALIMALNRRILDGDRLARTAWPSWSAYAGVRSLDECTLGIVGLGRIGAALAARMRPFVDRIVGYDPAAPGLVDGVEPVANLAELLRVSNVVSLHLPLLAETRHLIDRQALSLLPRGALVVNVSRGGLIDEDALADALLNGHIGGAGLDVLGNEPPEPANRLLRAPRVILSPHAAWLSDSTQRRLQRWTVTAVLELLRGGAPTHGRIAVARRR